jgi:uncharacterized protein
LNPIQVRYRTALRPDRGFNASMRPMGLQGSRVLSSPWLFFALTFAWTWLFWVAAALSGSEWTEPAVLLLFALGGIGPSLTGVVLTYVTRGREDRRDFWRRVLSFRQIGFRWAVVILAFAVVPVVLGIGLAVAAGAEPGDVAGAPSLAIGGAAVFALAAALAEELGWRGYVLDRLQERYAALTASIVTGVFWAAWHVPLYFVEGTFQNENGFGSPEFWFFSLTLLPQSVLYTWLYNSLGRSILSAIVFHWATNVTGEALSPEGAALWASGAVTLAFAAAVVAMKGPSLGKKA